MGNALASQKGAPYNESYSIETAIMDFWDAGVVYLQQPKYEPGPFLVMKKCLAPQLIDGF